MISFKVQVFFATVFANITDVKLLTALENTTLHKDVEY